MIDFDFKFKKESLWALFFLIHLLFLSDFSAPDFWRARDAYEDFHDFAKVWL